MRDPLDLWHPRFSLEEAHAQSRTGRNKAEMTADEIATFQIGTHPLLAASPVAHQLVNAAELALAKMRWAHDTELFPFWRQGGMGADRVKRTTRVDLRLR